MKHGRPQRVHWNWVHVKFCYDHDARDKGEETEMKRGWRREHAARVWQAMGCLAMVAQAWRLGLSAIDCDERGHWPEWWVTP